MNFLNSLIDLISVFFKSGMFSYWYVYLIALAFIASVPCIIRKVVRK